MKTLFDNHNTFFNQGVLTPTDYILNNTKFKRVLIIHGKNSFCSSLSSYFQNLNKDKLYLNSFSFNPKFEEIEYNYNKIYDFNPEIIFAVGGGSILDISKIIRLLLSNKITPNKLKNFLIYFTKKEIRIKNIPLIKYPTTAGSGAEVTNFSVLYFKNKKISITTPNNNIDKIILDTSLVKEAPTNIKANSAFDALVQSMEAYWSKNGNFHSSKVARLSWKILWNTLNRPDCFNRIPCLNNLIKGSYLSGCAINIAKTTAAHALSYGLTSQYNIAHGEAVSAIFEQIINFNIENHKTSCNEINAKSILMTNEIKIKSLNEFLEKFKALKKRFGLRSYRKLFLTYQFDIKILLDSVNYERLNNHPSNLSKSDIIEIYTKISK